jgi:hypothetical protein
MQELQEELQQLIELRARDLIKGEEFKSEGLNVSMIESEGFLRCAIHIESLLIMYEDQ